MKANTLFRATLAVTLLTAGCDNILGIDNYDAPDTTLSGRVIFQGEPVGIRTNAVQLALWQTDPGYEIVDFIPVYVNQEGYFSTTIFKGNYEIGLRDNNGPWMNSPTRIPVAVNGNTTVDVPVAPYYTIQDPVITFDASVNQPYGAITATFRVGQINPVNQLEFVGVYLGYTRFVDRTPNSVNIANSIRERTRTQIQSQLNSNGTITITFNLPNTVHNTQGPDRRNFVFIRIGVKTVGVTELWYTPVQEIAI
jgi:hypothetical protein